MCSGRRWTASARDPPMTKADTIVVSNRGPLSFRFDAEHNLEPLAGGGGLVSALRPLLAGADTDAMWFSMTMGAADEAAVAAGRMLDPSLALRSVTVDPGTYRMAYDVIANTTLWYLHHHLFDLPRRPRFDRHWHAAWDGYRAYNRAMADVVSAEAPNAAAVLVQDYHFSLLGQMLRESRPDLRTVHFCHIPFADPNMLRVLPDAAARELMAGLAGFGACGFHAQHWAEGFRACFAHAELAGSTIAPPTFVSSLSPDHDGLLAEAASPECTRSVAQLRSETGGSASSCGSTGWSLPRTSCGACWRSKSCWPPGRSGSAPWSTWRSSTPRARGWPTTWPSRPRSPIRRSASTTPGAPRHGHPSCCTSRTTGPVRWPR